MNINENLRDERKNLRQIKGCTYKITNISPAMRSFVTMHRYCTFTQMSDMRKIFNMNIHEFLLKQ